MFVTDRFVYLHLPKTGGTFVASVLARIHARRGDAVETIWVDPAHPPALPPISRGRAARIMLTTRNQHGTRRDIPPLYADRPVLATIRNPYERYVSQYEFAWWRHQPDMFGPIDDVRRRYPSFPALSFEDYLDLANSALLPFRESVASDDSPGMHTQQFLEYFFRDPHSAFARLLAGTLSADDAARELTGLRLLNQCRLNDDLAAALDEMGYAADEVDTVRRAARVWPPEGGRALDAPWERYYSKETMAMVARKERWLFEWIPEFRTLARALSSCVE
ncbi:MAG: hypothetical protein IT184_13140 [Acidobacteria bacterium]|nr:hypothetical protein [Acidobacteriota bacterium]